MKSEDYYNSYNEFTQGCKVLTLKTDGEDTILVNERGEEFKLENI